MCTNHFLLLESTSQVSDAYPINALRNLAMKHVYTEYMLLLDGDFIVSPHFEASFHLAVADTQSLLSVGDHVSYVVPAFELVADKFNSHQVWIVRIANTFYMHNWILETN